MKKTKKQIKKELKTSMSTANTFDGMVDNATVYILDNFKLRDRPIDSEEIFRKKRRLKNKRNKK